MPGIGHERFGRHGCRGGLRLPHAVGDDRKVEPRAESLQELVPERARDRRVPFRAPPHELFATFEPGEDAAGNFRQLLFYERGSGVFPDPPNRWNETCRVHGAAVIDGTIVCAGSVGLATGLPELTGRNYFYGGPGEYPVEGINVCRGPAAKGYHAPPYEGRLWFFDADEIAAAERPSDPMPYAIVNLSSPELLGPNGGCGQSPGSIVWDEQRQRIYLPCGGANPVIHVFGMKKR